MPVNRPDLDGRGPARITRCEQAGRVPGGASAAFSADRTTEKDDRGSGGDVSDTSESAGPRAVARDQVSTADSC
jgi:hypothetical protein